MLSTYWAIFLTIGIVHTLAVMAPGPDFILITRNSLLYSRRSGFWSALGLGLGVMVHFTYSLFGLGWVISKSLLLMSAIKLCGAAYLIYLGVMSLRSRGKLGMREMLGAEEAAIAHDVSPMKALRMGFMTNLLNPKTILYFLSLFSQIIDPETPLLVEMVLGVEAFAITVIWFALLAYLFSHDKVRQRFSNAHKYIEKILGACLLLFGIKLATSTIEG